MHTILHSDPSTTNHALSHIGLSEDVLLAAVMQGYLARTNCTANHPPLYPSFVAWGETVKALRDQLAPLGWARNEEKNYSRTIHPEGHTAIAVATGDAATGLATLTPSTKSAKGPSTLGALEVNRHQAWLPGFEPDFGNADEHENQPTTWLLLVHHAENELRCELSLPLDVSPDGRIAVWKERILLAPVPLDPKHIETTLPSLPDIEVEVRRKV